MCRTVAPMSAAALESSSRRVPMTPAPSLEYPAAWSDGVSGQTDPGPSAKTVARQDPGFAAVNRLQLSAASSRCGEITLRIWDMRYLPLGRLHTASFRRVSSGGVSRMVASWLRAQLASTAALKKASAFDEGEGHLLDGEQGGHVQGQALAAAHDGLHATQGGLRGGR